MNHSIKISVLFPIWKQGEKDHILITFHKHTHTMVLVCSSIPAMFGKRRQVGNKPARIKRSRASHPHQSWRNRGQRTWRRAALLAIYQSNLVPKVRFELTRCCHRGILNPLRLPFRHLGTDRPFIQAMRQGPEGAANFMPHRLDRPTPPWSEAILLANKAFRYAQTAL